MTSPAEDRLDQALRTAIAAGILPPDATRPPQDTRPWPVVLLTALGAWLAAGPLLGVVGMLLGDLIRHGVGPYLVGLLVLAGAVVVLRSRDVPIFFEQLAVPGLLVGGGSLAFGLFRDLPFQGASLAMALIALGVGIALPRPWLRVLLGAAAAGFAVIVLVPERLFKVEQAPLAVLWLSLHGLLAAWLGGLMAQRRVLNDGARAPVAAAVESMGAGWLLTVLVGLCWLAGMTFLVGGALGGGFMGEVARELGSHRKSGIHLFTQACSAALALLAAALAARKAPSLRQPLAAGVAVVLVALAWFLPSLGGVCLVLAMTATTQRWRLAGAAAVAAAWIIGSFYYQLQWTLANKAVVLVVAGALLGALAWLAHRRGTGADAAADAVAAAPRERRATALIGLAAVATLLVANFAIWQKQELIAGGKAVFVELAPVDPRSLMQGDFMRLNYRLPDNTSRTLDPLSRLGRPHVIATLDARGVATLPRVADPGTPPAAGEMRIELTPKDGRWILVSDAWFFREGDGKRFESAKYGEFRVMPDGRALLVGLADAGLKRIEP